MIRLAPLLLLLVLLLGAPAAHADTCSVPLTTGQSCLFCPNSCTSGDYCRDTDATCQPVPGQSGGSGSPSGAAPTTPGGTQPGSPTTPGGTQPTGQSSGSNGSGGNSTTLLNPLSSGTSLQSLLQAILAFVVKIGTVVVVLMLVYVGYLFATAQGEPAEISKAKDALMWTIIGALILLGAQAIASGIQATANALSTGS